MSSDQLNSDRSGDSNGISTGRKWMRGIFYTFLIIIALLFCTTLLLKLQPVQQWIVDKVSRNLSQKWNTEVSIERVNFSLFDQFIFEDVLILDHHQDTAVASEKVVIDFMQPFKTLSYRHLVLEEVRLEGGRAHMKTYRGEELNNFEKIWGLSERTSNKEDPSLKLFVDRLFLDSVIYEKTNQNLGTYQRIFLPDGIIRVGEVDFPRRTVTLRRVKLKSPRIFVENEDVAGENDSPASDSTEKKPNVNKDTAKWAIDVEVVDLLDGQFRLRNLEKYSERQRPGDVFDWAFLDFNNIDVRAENFHQQDLFFTGDLKQLSFLSNTGFEVEALSASSCRVGRDGLVLEDFNLKTPLSKFQDRLQLSYKGYPAFRNVANEVNIDASIRNSYTAFRDLIYFAPELSDQPFFVSNLYEQINLRGDVRGTINSLDFESLYFQLGDRARLRGDLYSRNLAVKGEQKLRMNIESMQTRMQTLRNILPNFNPPPSYNRLGAIDFHGDFDGTFNEFTASGEVLTELGKAEIDLDMNLSGGRENASYSGDLKLSNFNLGTFSGNEDFGRVGFSATVDKGSGLSLDALEAVMEGKIDSISYRGYSYQNIEVDGNYNDQEFQGELAIEDPNIDLSLRGNILFNRKNPLLDFEADVQKMDLKKLNFSDSSWVFSGLVDLNFEGLDIDETTGSVSVLNAEINTYEGVQYRLDTVQLITRNLTDSTRIIEIDSDVLTMDMRGRFQFSELWPLTKNMANQYYPSFAAGLGWKPEEEDVSDASMNIEIDIPDTKNLLELIHPALDTIRNASITGYVQSSTAKMHWEFSFPRIKYKDWEFYDIYEYTDVNKSLGNMVFTVDSTIKGNKLELEAVNLFADLYKDSIDFTVNSVQYSDLVNQLNIEGVFYLNDLIPELQIQNSGITLMGEKWAIDPNNYIRAGKDTFKAHNIQFEHEEKTILVQSTGHTGLEARLEDFNLEPINAFWAFDPIDFGGRVSGNLYVDDIFDPTSFDGGIESDSIFLNEKYYGALDVDAHLDSTRVSPVQFDASLIKGEQQLTGKGYFYPPGKQAATDRTMDVAIDLRQFPLNAAEFFLGDGISSTNGQMNGSLQLVGTKNSRQLLGTVDLTGGATRIDYLGTTIFIDAATIQSKEDYFSVTGTTIRDIYGNTGQIVGGIRHDDLRNFRLDASLDSDRFLVLNTDQTTEDLYYGHAIGAVYAEFTGTFRQSNIYVNATTGDGTRFFIQADYEEKVGKLKHIRFVDQINSKKEDTEVEERKGPRGLSLTLDLIATPEAEVQIIFDERAGDIIRGTGEGDIQLNVSRSGEVQMYGKYTILDGNYLFTLPVVKKPFEVNSGSTLRWSGDPLNATIDIEAVYLGLSAAPYNLIQEYITAGPTAEQAKNTTDVNLTLHLTGSLLRPEIAFDISFPDLTGELKNYAQNKVEILRSDQNEMNRQVFGLIMLNSFLPSTSSFKGDYAARAMIFNTGSEFLSNLVSVYLSDLLNQAVSDVDAISGIDVDIGYSLPTGDLLLEDDESDFDPNKSEVQVQLKNRLFNDRIIFNVGGKHVSNSALTSGSYMAGNVSFEYVLTEDRRLRIRAYTSTDQVPEGRRIRYGVGLNYRREFNTMENFLKGLRSVLGLVEEDEKKEKKDEKDAEEPSSSTH